MMNIALFCSLALLSVAVGSQGNQFGVVVEKLDEEDAHFDTSLRTEADVSEHSSSSTSGMDKLIYEMVAEEEEDTIENAFETAALRTTALKAKLDIVIDETILKLQSLKNLRRHLEKAYKFADKFLSTKLTNKEGRRYVLAELQKSIDQVEQTINSSSVTSPPSKPSSPV